LPNSIFFEMSARYRIHHRIRVIRRPWKRSGSTGVVPTYRWKAQNSYAQSQEKP